jgi:hypothetical protein
MAEVWLPFRTKQNACGLCEQICYAATCQRLGRRVSNGPLLRYRIEELPTTLRLVSRSLI